MPEAPPLPHLNLLPQKHHETFEASTQILKELPILGRMHIVEAIPNALRADRHAGEYEIHYVVSGTLNFWVGDRNYEIRPGMTFLTQPDELHGGVDAILEPGEWYWLRLRFPSGSKPLPELSGATTRKLKRDFAAMNAHLFAGSLQLRSCFARLIEEHRQPSAYGPVMARLILHELLVTVIRDYAKASSAGATDSPFLSVPIQRAVQWIQVHLMEELPSIDDIAVQVGLSESHFRRRFHEETGFSPLEYVTRQRVLRAKELLHDKRLSITRLAFDLGFQSSGYFAQVFRKMTGMTPSEYRVRYCQIKPSAEATAEDD
ncbi:MAG: AraC family transcriptional regulator [Tepidisphaeraceae bacterium]